MLNQHEKLLSLLKEFLELEINKQLDYDKFYLYSLITHSTAIEGSTITEVENQLLFDEGITAKGRPLEEQLMNLDLKEAYEKSLTYTKQKKALSPTILKNLASLVMKKTGSEYNTALGSFSSRDGDFRLLNVTAGAGGKSYVNFTKIPSLIDDFCNTINKRKSLIENTDIINLYILSFDAHFELVTIHPWADGNGRMSRLVMNQLQFEYGLIPSKITKESKADYIQALINTREKNDIEIIRSFMFSEHIKNIEEIISEHKKSITSDVGVNVGVNVGINTHDRKERIISIIKETPGINTRAISLHFSNITQRSIERDIKDLREKNIIFFKGSAKTGGYFLV